MFDTRQNEEEQGTQTSYHTDITHTTQLLIYFAHTDPPKMDEDESYSISSASEYVYSDCEEDSYQYDDDNGGGDDVSFASAAGSDTASLEMEDVSAPTPDCKPSAKSSSSAGGSQKRSSRRMSNGTGMYDCFMRDKGEWINYLFLGVPES